MATGVLECAAAITGIIQFSVQLTKLVEQYRAYKRARKELKNLRTNASIFSDTLDYFGHSIQSFMGNRLSPVNDPKFRNLLLKISRSVANQMEEIERTFYRLRVLGDSNASPFSRMGAKLQWAWIDGREVKELLASLEPIKSTMSLVVVIATLEQTTPDKRPSAPITEDQFNQFKSCRAQIKLLRKEIKQSQRQYEALRTLNTSDTSDSFYNQVNQGQLIQEIVKHAVHLARRRVSASAAVMRDIAPTGTLSTSTSTGERSSTRSNPRHDPYNHLHRPDPSPPPPPSSPLLPTPPPRRHEQEIHAPRPLSIPPSAHQGMSRAAGPSWIAKGKARELPPYRVEEIQVGPSSAPIDSGANDSPTNQPPLYPEPLPGHDSPPPQEEPPPTEGPSSGGAAEAPESPQPRPPRYRLVVRKGKMVSKEWPRPRAGILSSDSSASDSDSE